MTQSLQHIFSLEDDKQFDAAFEAYHSLYTQNKLDYEVWKHFYFFLWIAIEDAPSSFPDKINLRPLLRTMLEEGKMAFSNHADFNFIAGYTVSLFPYEYGDYDEFELQGNQMLQKAKQLQPKNPIYNMVGLRVNSDADRKKYRKARKKAAPKVLKTFNGNGLLNKYFRQMLYGLPKKPTVNKRYGFSGVGHASLWLMYHIRSSLDGLLRSRRNPPDAHT